MTQEEILCFLYELRDLYKKEKINAATREYNIYYAGSVDAIEKAIKKIKPCSQVRRHRHGAS